MRHGCVIFSFLAGLHLHAFSFASEAPIDDISVRPLVENSTDIFSIFQILIRARQAYADADFEHAAKDYNILIQYDPSLEEAVIGAAKSYIELGQLDLAIQTLRASKISSPEADILSIIAKSMTLETQAAQAYLSESVNLYQDSRLWNLLGHTLVATRDIETSSNAFKQAETLGQKPGVLDNNLGMLALQSGDIDSAYQHMLRAVQLSPNTAKFDNNRRLILLLQARYLEALQNISSKRAISLLQDAAIISSKRGEDLLAQLLLDKAREINPVF